MSLASSSCKGLVVWLILDSKKFEFFDSKTRFHEQIQFYSYKTLLQGKFRLLIFFFEKCFENGLISCRMCYETQGTLPDRSHAFWEHLEWFCENRKFQVEMRFLRLILIFSTQMSWRVLANFTLLRCTLYFIPILKCRIFSKKQLILIIFLVKIRTDYNFFLRMFSAP